MHSYHYARTPAYRLAVIGLIIMIGGCDSETAITGTDGDRETLPATVITEGNDEFEVIASSSDDPASWTFSMKRRDTRVNDSLHFEWDFGDGSIVTADSTEHAFTEPGFYTITVTGLDSRDRVEFILTLNVTVPESTTATSTLFVDAGLDNTVNGNVLVFLDGSRSSHVDGNPLEFLWTQIAGPSVLLANTTNAIASFTSPALSSTDSLAFSLVVSDGTLTAEDTVVVEVLGVGAPATQTCEFSLTLDDGTNPTDEIEGARPLALICSASKVGGGPLEQGVLTWTFDAVTDAGGVDTHAVMTHSFTTGGLHAVAVALTVGGVTVGCQSTRTGTTNEQVAVWPSVEGVIASGTGGGISGIAVTAAPGGTTDVTDAAGSYTVHVPFNWSGAVTPQHISYTFAPSAHVMSEVIGDVLAQKFTATTIVLPPVGGGCTSDAQCDDGVFCNGAELCSNGACVGVAAPCSGQTCNETLDICGGCVNDADCDDGLFCNGAEACVVGACASGVAPCGAQTCIEASDTCVSCVVDADCDDSNACTDDSCDGNGQCVNASNDANSCDDGAFCNGAETCSSGVCVSAGDPCSGQFCDEGTDSCASGLLVSGHLAYFDSASASGVNVLLSGTGGSFGTDFSVATDGSGNFQQVVPSGWSGTMTSDVDYRFSPTSRALSNVTTANPNQDFSAFRNFYVSPTGNDVSAGTFSAEFATISRAAISVNPGDTVYVKAGTYNEWVKIRRNGTATNRITFRNYQNDVVTIDGQGSRAGCLTVGYHDRYTGGQYITIDGFYLTGTKNGTGSGDGGACALMWHSESSEFRNLTAYRCGHGTPIASGSLGAGIALRGANKNCVVDSCRVYENYRSGLLVSQAGGSTPGAPNNITVNNCYIYDNPGSMTGDDEDSDGIWVAAGVGIDNNISVTNCVLHGNADDGIDAPSSRGVLMANNIVFEQGRNTAQGDGNGIKVSTSVGGAPNGGGNHVIRHNIVFSNARGGIDQDISSAAPHNFFYNNTIYGNDNHGLILDVGGGANIDTAAVSINNLMANNNRVGGSFLDYRAGSGGCGGMSQSQTVLDSNFNLVGDGCLHTNEGANTMTGNSLLVNPDAAIDTTWQGTTQTTLDFIRAQVYANFTLQASSPAVDAGKDLGLGQSAIDSAAADSGSGAIPYFDLGALELGLTP